MQSVNQANDFTDFSELLSKASKHARDTIPFGGDIPYGKRSQQKVDIFGTDTLPPDCGIVLFIHGGKWKSLDKEHSSHLVIPLVKANVRPIIADFNLATEVTLEEMIEEIREAAKFVFQYALKHQVRSVVVCGHSSGAHLTSCLLDPNWLQSLSSEEANVFTGVVLISGLYDITGMVTNELNQVLQLNEERAKKCSSALYEFGKIKEDCAVKQLKVLICVGSGEMPIFVQQSELLRKVLKDHKIFDVEYCLVEKLNHYQTNLSLQNADYEVLLRMIAMVRSKL